MTPAGNVGKPGALTVHVLKNHPMESNIYLITAGRNILVDTGLGGSVERLMGDIGGILGSAAVECIILTHSHIDHTGGAAAFAGATGAPIFIHSSEAGAVREGDSVQTGADMFGVVPTAAEVETLEEGDLIDLGSGDSLEVMHTPGHSEGSLCLFHRGSGSLFSGDTVFTNGGVGRWDLPGGSLGRLRQSIERLLALDVKNIYPGHMSYSEGDGREHIELGLMSLSMY
jgi:hydroxyacylglutathione hydrolase